jgi:hypothetical protein
VEVGIVVPVELGVEADTTSIATTTAVRLAEGSATVPGEANHEPAEVARVGWEEGLRSHERGLDFFLDRFIPTGWNRGAIASSFVGVEATRVVLGCGSFLLSKEGAFLTDGKRQQGQGSNRPEKEHYHYVVRYELKESGTVGTPGNVNEWNDKRTTKTTVQLTNKRCYQESCY